MASNFKFQESIDFSSELLPVSWSTKQRDVWNSATKLGFVRKVILQRGHEAHGAHDAVSRGRSRKVRNDPIYNITIPNIIHDLFINHSISNRPKVSSE